MNEKKSCKTCVNAIFDEHWGEYKCKVFQHRMYLPDDKEDCIEYEKGEPTKTKRQEDEED